MDFTSSLIETGRKFENGTYLDSLGNYMAMACLSFLYMTVYQILAYTWGALKPVGKSNKSATLRKDDEEEEKQVDETNRIYHALEKFAKVSMSKHL